MGAPLAGQHLLYLFQFCELGSYCRLIQRYETLLIVLARCNNGLPLLRQGQPQIFFDKWV